MTIGRAEWLERFRHETDTDVYTNVEVSAGRAGVEFDGGRSRVDVYFSDDATDIRVGDLQFIVGRDRLSVLRQHGPYPIREWTVAYDGPIPKREQAK